MVAGIFTELALPAPRRRFTIGITDDVGGTSLPYDDTLDIEEPDTLRAVFYGLGSDGTVGANKNTIKILGADPDVHAQAYFVYDSKKSGGAHRVAPALRAAPDPRAVPGEPGRLRRLPPPRPARHGRRARLRRGRCDPAAQRPAARRRGVGRPARPGAAAGHRQAAARLRRRRRRRGPRRRPARSHQHRAADLLLRDLRRAARRRGGRARQGGDPQDVQPARVGGGAPQRGRRRRHPRLAARGAGPVAPHLGARDARHRAHRRARVRAHGDRRDDGRPRRRPPGQRDAGRRHLPERHHGLREAPDLRRRGGLGPGRLHPVRHLQLRVPAQRHPVEVLRRRRRSTRRPTASVGTAQRRRPARLALHPAGLRRGLHRLRPVRRGLPGQPGAATATRKAINLEPLAPVLEPERENIGFFETLPVNDRSRVDFGTVRGTQFLQPLFEFSGACSGLRRDALPQGAHPALRRAADRGERDRLLVDLRRQPADDAVDQERRGARTGLVELAVRGQRRVRPRAAARRRPAHAAWPAPGSAQLREEVGTELADGILDAGQVREFELTRPARAGRRAADPARRPRRARWSRTCAASPTTCCGAPCGSSAETAGPTTSARAGWTTCSPAGATSTCSCSTPRCTPTPVASRRSRPRSAPSRSSRPPARRRRRRTSPCRRSPTATSTWPGWRWAPTRTRR